jgi:hypothetical protein
MQNEETRGFAAVAWPEFYILPSAFSGERYRTRVLFSNP